VPLPHIGSSSLPRIQYNLSSAQLTSHQPSQCAFSSSKSTASANVSITATQLTHAVLTGRGITARPRRPSSLALPVRATQTGGRPTTETPSHQAIDDMVAHTTQATRVATLHLATVIVESQIWMLASWTSLPLACLMGHEVKVVTEAICLASGIEHPSLSALDRKDLHSACVSGARLGRTFASIYCWMRFGISFRSLEDETKPRHDIIHKTGRFATRNNKQSDTKHNSAQPIVHSFHCSCCKISYSNVINLHSARWEGKWGRKSWLSFLSVCISMKGEEGRKEGSMYAER
jgi:hypothetical protein